VQRLKTRAIEPRFPSRESTRAPHPDDHNPSQRANLPARREARLARDDRPLRRAADAVWRALTDGEVTKSYWNNRLNTSDWKAGSEWRREDYDDPAIVEIVGTVVESDPPRRLLIQRNRRRRSMARSTLGACTFVRGLTPPVSRALHPPSRCAP
jgi:hypothetical protein